MENSNNQIAAEATNELWLEGLLDSSGKRVLQETTRIINVAIEKATEEAHAAGMNQGWNEGREHERKGSAARATASDIPEILRLERINPKGRTP